MCIYSDVVQILATADHSEVNIGQGIFLKSNSSGICMHYSNMQIHICTILLSESYKQFAKILFQLINSKCLDRQVAVELSQASESGKLMFKDLEVCRAFYTYNFIAYIKAHISALLIM